MSEGELIEIKRKGKQANDTTIHKIFFKDSRNMSEIKSDSVHLIVTSPPYPMIEMWDEPFKKQSAKIANLFIDFHSTEADKEKEKVLDKIYNEMHNVLNDVWKESYRVLVDGGMLCINVGDATRKMNGLFRLFPNHARTIELCEKTGFTSLPYVIWKKPTNKPNAFLGSGFLPPNAYVTLDSEYVLIFRKGNLRKFDVNDSLRYESAITKDERDVWFSQIWDDIRGIKQENHLTKRRTAAFPSEIPCRLIKMFSIKKDIVLDPFLGTGTTSMVAEELQRNSIGYEIDKTFKKIIKENVGIEGYSGKYLFFE
ncbi:site-specific DNA-methyltransferase [Candidatus Woesearchaeota archaeon]|nr:site-specific DNA-methyltransferase [Candidatus Woesearchaeota archaeon]